VKKCRNCGVLEDAFLISVNEIFPTFQGEGTFTGCPATFIRLQGCPVGCHWCDTKHTWPNGKPSKRITTDQMILKTKDAPTFAEVSESEIVNVVKEFNPTHFVITGGEPFVQDIYELVKQLGEFGLVQIETSGTHQINVPDEAFVTVSPKINMQGGYQVLKESILRADEIKMPVADQADLNNFLELLSDLPELLKYKIWLTPVSQDNSATKLCVQMAMKMNWRVSLQTHKFMNVR